MPRLMQRSHRLRSSGPLKMAVPPKEPNPANVPAPPARPRPVLGRDCASGGSLPSGGSMTSDVRRETLPRSSQCGGGDVADPTAPALDRSAVSRSKSALSEASCLSACERRCAYSASLRKRRSPYCACRSNGTLNSASLLNVPWRSGSPQGVLGTAGPCADVATAINPARAPVIATRRLVLISDLLVGQIARGAMRAGHCALCLPRPVQPPKNRSNLLLLPRRPNVAADARKARVGPQWLHLR